MCLCYVLVQYHSDINDSLLLSNFSYSLIRKDRPDKFGGMTIFVKHCLTNCTYWSHSIFSTAWMYHYWSAISSLHYRFICIYNPPSLAHDINHTLCLCSFLDSYCNTKTPVIVVGDFNYPYIDWYAPVNTCSMCSSLFLTCILQNGHTQVVNLPTLDI